MEDQDIFNQIKTAANNDAQPFGSMDQVWHRVEEKLDKKILKKENTVWKKIAVAASLLLVGTLGYQVFKNDSTPTNSNEIITKTDSIQKAVPENDALVSSENANPAIKKEAGEILRKQLVAPTRVALEEIKRADAETIHITDSIAFKGSKTESYGAMAKDKSALSFTQSKIAPSEKVNVDNVELFINKENRVSAQKKEEPLLVFDDLVKNKQTVTQMDVDEVESLVELKEPLYIINGVEYTEQELFGPNPTSPYTPLTKQEIETISILQDEKAVSLYGEKGKKGVVIITTKNGKPTAKKGK